MDQNRRGQMDNRLNALFREPIEAVVFKYTHEERYTSPPGWKFWEKAKLIWAVRDNRLPAAAWLTDKLIEQLPSQEQRAEAREPVAYQRILERVILELESYPDPSKR